MEQLLYQNGVDIVLSGHVSVFDALQLAMYVFFDKISCRICRCMHTKG